MSISGVLSSSQISSLVSAAETQYDAPITTLQNQEAPLQTQISAIGSLSSALSSLQSAIQGFSNLSSMPDMQATVGGNGNILTATASNTAQSGTYQIAVSGLATAQSVYSQDFSSQNSVLGSGTIGITVGSGTTVNVQITSGNDTLAGIENAINGAGAGVSASIVYDGTGYRLSVTGNQTGAANSFTLSTTGSALTGLSYTSGAYNMTENQAAQDATATVNGIAITSASNSFSGAIQGVSFSVSATGSTSIDVSQSTSAAQSAISTFVSAFNAASTAIQKATAYTPAVVSSGQSGTGSSSSGTAGPLLGNPVINSIENQMLSLISTETAIGPAGSSDNIGFGNIGITLTSSGTISVDSSTLSGALSQNYNQVLGLFGGMGGSSNPDVQYSGSTPNTSNGVYTVDVTSNSSTMTSGTVNGYMASGSNGVMTVGSGPAQGLSLSVASGVTPSATVFFNQGISQSLGSLLNSALGSSGVLQQSENDVQNQITSMNQQITSYQATAKQQIQAMISQFDSYENTSSTESETSNQLDAIFSSLFGSSSGS